MDLAAEHEVEIGEHQRVAKPGPSQTASGLTPSSGPRCPCTAAEVLRHANRAVPIAPVEQDVEAVDGNNHFRSLLEALALGARRCFPCAAGKSDARRAVEEREKVVPSDGCRWAERLVPARTDLPPLWLPRFLALASIRPLSEPSTQPDCCIRLRAIEDHRRHAPRPHPRATILRYPPLLETPFASKRSTEGS